MLNRIFIKVIFSTILSAVYIASAAQCSDVYIAGLMDGYAGSAIPKFVLVCATEDIPDLSIYSVGTANNGGGSSVPGEYTFPDDALSAGDCVTLATEIPMFLDYFGCNPTYTNGSAINVNGDDAIELFCNGMLIDIYGDANVDGTGQAWEYTDGWAVRLSSSTFPNAIFSSDDWTIAPDQTPTMHHFNDNGMMTVDCPDCSIVSITTGAQSACDPVTNTYTQEITIDFTGGPGTGDLIVNNQRFTLSSSPQNMTLSGLNSDGMSVDVTATFSDLPGCTSTEADLFVAPVECLVVPPVCSITNVAIQNITCDVNGINAEVCFDYQDPLSTDVSVTIDNILIGNYAYPTISGGCINISTTIFFDESVVLLVEDTQSSDPIYISEFHYDNASTDVGEFIEITAPVGTSLTGYSLSLYNGTDNSVYETIALSGEVTGAAGGCGVIAFDATGIQNGPDAIALVDGAGNVIEFISYEGVLVAVDGPAQGLKSMDIGVEESVTSMITTSLSLVKGAWTVADPNSRGALNTGARCIDACASATRFNAPACCSDFDVVAFAFCSDVDNSFVESSYYIQVESISGGQNSGTYDVTVQGVTLSFSGAPLTFGPISHSATGNNSVPIIINETSSSCTESIELVETLCTDINGSGVADNDIAFCQCNGSSGTANPGVIFSQAQPGTFMSGGMTNQTQIYLLAEDNMGLITILDINGTGLFDNLEEGSYSVYAVNYDDINSADVQAALVVGQSIDIMSLINQDAPYDDECYTVCGPALYMIECSPNQGTLGCNDHLNITLSTECTVSITPSVLLEGEQGDNENYIYTITDSNGNIVDVDNITSNTSDDPVNFIGQDLTFTVVDNCTGNSCWGIITLEDKSIPELNCNEVTVLCTEVDNITPGAPIKGWDRDILTNQSVGGSTSTLNFTVDKVMGAVTNVVLNFEADIQDVSNLGLSLSSPNGQTTIDLIDQSGFSNPCNQNNINVCLTDIAILSHADLQSTTSCRATRNAVIGNYRPLDAFSRINGDDANGVWSLKITNAAGTVVNVIEADLQVTTNEGNLLTSADIISFGGCQSMPEFSFEDVESGTNCANGLWTTITREWTVSNPSSGRTNNCIQNINVRLYTISDIIWPKDFNDIDQPSLQCDEVVDTGMPMFPCGATVNACNFLISEPTVLDFPICGDSYKRIYTWTVLDWCTGESIEYNQIVKVEDTEPILVSCVPEQLTLEEADAIDYDINEGVYRASLDGNTCTASWVIQPPLVIDNTCNTNTTLQVFYLPDDDTDPSGAPEDGEYILATGDVITGLPSDRRTWIRMVVTDECGNTGECFTEVDVIDNIRPTCIAEEFIVVGLSEQDEDLYGRVSAIAIDNGSFDCTELTYQVRRFSASCNPLDLVYGDFVEFCCDDLDADGIGEIPVELRVTDIGGNFCVVRSIIKIENKIPDNNICPDGLIVDCLQDISDLSLTGLPSSAGACGDVGLDLDEISIVENTIPTVKPAGTSPLFDVDGDGTDDIVPAFDEGCGFGALKRSFLDGSQLVCEQFFVVTPLDPLDPNDIVFPADMTTDCSAVDPGQPQFVDGPCSNTGFTIESDTIRVVNNACYKIFNTHTVIDWCRYNQTGGQDGIYSDQQVITVIDDQAPIVTAENNLEFTFMQECSAPTIIIPALAVDNQNCSNDILRWSIEVDYNSNGSIDVSDNESSISGDTLFVNLSDVPLGKNGHRIKFIVDDACGNVSETEVTFTVIDRKAPTPYCLNVATATMDNGSVEIWASDFNIGSADNCTLEADLRYTFSDVPPPSGSTFYDPVTGLNSNQASFDAGDSDRWDATLGTAGRLIFDSDINPNGMAILEMYVWDECNNYDFCLVQLSVNGNEVPDVGAISGRIYTEYGEAVQSVSTSLNNMTENNKSDIITNELGEYAFYENEMNQRYNIKGEKNDDYLNGVSTYDLILIQKHILNDEKLDSPYKMIAADVSNDRSITAIDLIQLRKVILGIDNEFVDNESWRFVDQQDHLTVNDPWGYHDSIEIDNLSNDMATQDFIAVKIGDVNNSMIPNVVSQGTELRNKRTIEFTYNDAYVNKGELISVDLTTESKELYGYQFSFVAEDMEVTFCEGRDMYDENFHIFSKGGMTVSHNTDYPIDNSSAILTITLKAEKNGWLSEMIKINSQYIKTEAYIGTELEVVDIVLRESTEEQFNLYQNEPNPFSEETKIGFELPYEATVSMSLYNVSGQLIKTMVIDGIKGYNTLTLQKEDIGVTGLIYYKLESNKFSATKHMILIE